MNRDIFLDAVGYLDADILAEHLRQKEKLRSKLKSKRIIHVWRWSAIAACICLVVALGAVFIPDWSDAPDPIITDTKLESGFKPTQNGAEMSFNFCAYKSETNVFDLNDVTLEFYYGGYYYNGVEYTIENNQNCPTFDLYFENDQGDKYFIKHIDENFVSEKYSCELIFDENHNIKEVLFNHSETLTIPPELFTKPTGIIWFSVRGIDTFNPDSLGFITGKALFYKIENGKVILSDQEFQQDEKELTTENTTMQ